MYVRSFIKALAGIAPDCEAHDDSNVVSASLQLLAMSEPTSRSAPSYIESYNASTTIVRVSMHRYKYSNNTLLMHAFMLPVSVPSSS